MKAAAGPAWLLLIVLGFYWKILTKQFTWMDHPDMAYQILPWYQFQAAAWHRGEFPIWDPHLWGGQPLIAQIVPSGAYPLNWLMFLAPLHDGHINPLWINIHFVVAHLMAALFCYWLCRDLGRSCAASVLAGAAFSAGGFLGNAGWPQMLNGVLWLPLAVMFYLRSMRKVHPMASAALSGASLGVSFLSGHHQIPVLMALLMAGLWLYALWKERFGWRAWRVAGTAGLFTFMTSALQTLPAYEYGRQAIRWVGTVNPVFWDQYVPYIVHQRNSLYPLTVLGLILPGVHEREDTFLGVTLLALAMTALALGWRETAVRVWGAIAVGGLLFALGGFSVFHGAVYMAAPLAEKARSPHMAIYITQFALIVLAAYGLDALRSGENRDRAWVGRTVWTLAVAGALAMVFLVGAATVRPETSREYEGLAVLGLAALAAAALMRGWRRGHLSERAAVAMLVMLVLFELGTVTGRSYHHRDEPSGHLSKLIENTDAVAFLRRQPGPVRLEIDTDAVPYNIGDWEGLDQFRAYVAGLTTNVAQFEMDRLEGGRLASSLFSLNFYLGRKPMRADQQEVFTAHSGLKVYRNPEAYPRVWSVHDAAPVGTAELIVRLREAQDTLRRKAFLNGPAPRLDTCGGEDSVRLTARGAASLAVDADMRCKGLVVVSETFFPGWKATVDARPAEILEVYGALRGVVVEGGAHRIEMHYAPGTVYWGGALTAAGLLAAAGLLIRRLRAPASGTQLAPL